MHFWVLFMYLYKPSALPRLANPWLCFLHICFFLALRVQPRVAGSQETGVGVLASAPCPSSDEKSEDHGSLNFA